MVVLHPGGRFSSSKKILLRQSDIGIGFIALQVHSNSFDSTMKDNQDLPGRARGGIRETRDSEAGLGGVILDEASHECWVDRQRSFIQGNLTISGMHVFHPSLSSRQPQLSVCPVFTGM